MKIGILTQPLLTNYGGLLQNYALQTVLKKNGHTPITIDWEVHGYKNRAHELAYNIKIFISNILHGTIRKKKSSKEENKRRSHNVVSFSKKYISSTPKIKYESGFRKYGYMDAYIVGSDQCWRPIYNPFLEAMYLNFIGDHPIKIAYAASFGNDQWEYTSKQTQVCSKLISRFNFVSVREASGINLCKEYLNVEAKHVLDPTMLLDRGDYISLINNENDAPSEGDLFYYILDSDEEIINSIKKIGTQECLRPFTICKRENIDDAKNKKTEYSSVTSWIKAFHESKLIVVDSFHGMVFSIIFNKPFWVLGNKGRGQTRFVSLLSLFGLEDRLVSLNQLSILDIWSPIDWKRVNQKLGELRKYSIKVLLKALES